MHKLSNYKKNVARNFIPGNRTEEDIINSVMATARAIESSVKEFSDMNAAN